MSIADFGEFCGEHAQMTHHMSEDGRKYEKLEAGDNNNNPDGANMNTEETAKSRVGLQKELHWILRTLTWQFLNLQLNHHW